MTLTQEELRDPQNPQALRKNWRNEVFRPLLLRALTLLSQKFTHERDLDTLLQHFEADALRDNVGFLTLDIIMRTYEAVDRCHEYEIPDAEIEQGLSQLVLDDETSSNDYHGVYFFRGDALIHFRDLFAKLCGYSPLLDTFAGHRDLVRRHERATEPLEYPLAVIPMFPDSIVERQAAAVDLAQRATTTTPADLHRAISNDPNFSSTSTIPPVRSSDKPLPILPPHGSSAARINQQSPMLYDPNTRSYFSIEGQTATVPFMHLGSQYGPRQDLFEGSSSQNKDLPPKVNDSAPKTRDSPLQHQNSSQVDNKSRMGMYSIQNTVHERNLYIGTIDNELVIVCRQVDDFSVGAKSKATADKLIALINDIATTKN